jgi:hypothetical protein
MALSFFLCAQRSIFERRWFQELVSPKRVLCELIRSKKEALRALIILGFFRHGQEGLNKQ